MKTKPIVWKSILAAVLGLVIWLIVGILASVILALVAGLLLSIPVIGGILAWLLTRGDGEPTTLLIFMSASVSALAAMKLVEKICKHDRTTGLACKIMGVGMIATQAYFLLSNLFMDGGGSALANIFGIGWGCMIFGCGKESLQPDLTEDEPAPEVEPESRLRRERSNDLYAPMWECVADGMERTKFLDRYIDPEDLEYAAICLGVDIRTALQILSEEKQRNGFPPFEIRK